MLIYQGINLGHERFVSHLTRYCTWFSQQRQPDHPPPCNRPRLPSRPSRRRKKSPLENQGAWGWRERRSPYLAGTVTGASACPVGSFMNWKKLELGSTTSTSPGFENEAR